MRERIIMIFLLTFFIGCGGEDMNVTVMTPTIQCGMCQKNIEVGLSKLDGVGRSTVDLASKTTKVCLLYTSPSPRDQRGSRMPSSA